MMPATRALTAGTLPQLCTCYGKGDVRTGHWPGCQRGDAIRALLGGSR